MSNEKFAKLLTEAIYRIRTLENKSIRAVQDELGFVLGKKGGSSIEHWRKGNVPAKATDIELLAKAIINRSDLNDQWLQRFLLSAEYPFVDQLHDELFPLDEDETHTALLNLIPVHNNLLMPPTMFVGRDQELAEIDDYLRDPDCRLLTLAGPGGIGKTRLAMEAARRNISNRNAELFPHGVCFVSLASLHSADFIASTIGDALNFNFFSGEEDLEEQLLSYLQEKALLLIVDNLEHLVQEANFLTEILLRAPSVKMIATTRERLNLRGEWMMEIRGMSYPNLQVSSRFVSETAVSSHPHSPIMTDLEKKYSAIQLFIQSAQRACVDFEPSKKDKLHIIQICQLVEGIPLAIELAASWVRVLTCAEIAQEIEQNYEFLSTNWRDIPERHRSLQAVFDYSWDLLSDQERQVICKLSVFQNGFHRQAAAKVASASLILLSALVDKSFLKPIRQGEKGVRYEMHDLLRQYAEEKLQASSDKEKYEAYQRHAHYFAQFLLKYEPVLQGSGQAEALEEMGEDIENIRAGWQWVIDRQEEETVTKYMESLFQFYDIRSWAKEGLESFETAVQALQSPSSLLLGKLLARYGRFNYRLGQTDEARTNLNKSLALLNKENAPTEEAFTLNQLAYVAYRMGKHEEAIQLCNRSLELSRPIHAHAQIAESLQILGETVNVQGDYANALTMHQEGLSLSTTLGDQRGIAVSLNQIGYLEWRLGNYEEATQSCERSLLIFQAVGDQRGIAMTHKNLGNIASELGNHIEAQNHYRRGLRISEAIGHTWGVAAFLNNLASEAWELDEFKRGKILGEQSLAIWRETGYQLGMASTLETLGTIAEASNDYVAAKSYFQEALKITMDIGTRPLSLDILVGLAVIIAKEGNPAYAVEILTFVLDHPMTDQESKAKVGKQLPQLMLKLSPQELNLAEENGQAAHFEQVVSELLEAT